MKRYILTLSLTLTLGVVFSQNSTPQIELKKGHSPQAKNQSNSIKSLPADFPKYKDTGNPEADKLDYKTRKEKWISENPERYKALLNKNAAVSTGQRTQTTTRSK